MKKTVCIFLICWLPLFMPSAWAMSTGMLLGEAEAALVQQTIGHDTQKMACHQTIETQTSGKHTLGDVHAAHNTGKASHHACTHCVACIVVIASACSNPSLVLALKLSNQAIASVEPFYFSRDLAPFTKPPIRLS